MLGVDVVDILIKPNKEDEKINIFNCCNVVLANDGYGAAYVVG